MTICGDSDWTKKECLVYSISEDRWQQAGFGLKEGRIHPASVLLDNGTMVVFGGRSSVTEVMAKTDETFEHGPEMPVSDQGLCALKVRDILLGNLVPGHCHYLTNSTMYSVRVSFGSFHLFVLVYAT